MKLEKFTIFKKYYAFIIILVAYNVNAQESVFYSSETDSVLNSNKFSVEIYNLNFIKNNEYFNFISDGLTLLGTQIQPEFLYNKGNTIQLRAGMFLFKNYGENNIYKVIPTFSFKYKIDNYQQIILGNLFSRDNHNLIEPLMASERILSSEIIENGIQHKYKSKFIISDAWLNWEHYISKYSESRERFLLGVSSKILIFKDTYLPVQFTYYHKGGQINLKYRNENNSAGISDIFNYSFGIEHNILNSSKRNLVFSYYYLLHKANSDPLEYSFSNGNAHYLVLKYVVNNYNFLLGYYKANEFISPKGNEMFQTYSNKSNINYWNGILDNRYVGFTDPDRNLIFSKVFYEKRIELGVKFGFQLEGFYQLNSSSDLLGLEENKKHQFDYSYGIYIVFDNAFKF